MFLLKQMLKKGRAKMAGDNSSYEGDLKDGKYHGNGTLNLSNGNKYVGQFDQGKKHGQGAYSFANGNEYVGEWNDDERNGQGTFTWANGDKHVGEFVNDEFHGIGERIYISGDKYVGNFEQGKRHGQGTFTWSDGDKYVGEWFANKKHGQGAYSFANGNEYVGEWNDDKRSGEGTFTWANGDKHVGRIGVLPFRRISEFVNPADKEFLGLDHGAKEVLKRENINEAVWKCKRFVFSNGNGSEAFVPDTNIRIRLLDHEDMMDEGYGERSTGELRLYEGEDCIAWITNENNGRGIEKLINLAKLL